MDTKNRFLKIRLSDAESAAIRDRAATAGLTVSEYVRRIAVAGRVEQVVSNREVVYELRRLGAMLKSLYPKNANWTSEEKRKWWAGMGRLLEVANELEGEEKR